MATESGKNPDRFDIPGFVIRRVGNSFRYDPKKDKDWKEKGVRFYSLGFGFLRRDTTTV
jgi:hypothetical protein